MVVHLEHAAAARRAVVGAVGFTCLALFAEAHLAIGFDGKCRGGSWRLVGRKSAVAGVVRSGARRCEDGGSIGPIE